MAEREELAKALESADWSNCPIGNKALIVAAIVLLRAAPAVPDGGWRMELVPMEPASEVLEAMDKVLTQPSAGYWLRVYAAMLAASPALPTKEPTDG